MDDIHCAVIGAGVVGLAAAAALQRAGFATLVLERHGKFGTETSARNSEVIHSGLYYTPGSWKAKLCVRGRALLYDYCARTGVACRRTGKIIVAVDDAQQVQLRGYLENGRRNGVADLEWLTAAQVRALEPAVRAVAGVYSPSTGIVDSHALMLSLWGELEAHGGQLACFSPVARVARHGEGYALTLADGYTFRARVLVNAAGLEAPVIAARLHASHPLPVPPAQFCKGHYYQLSGISPFQRLVYPVAAAGGLGIHVTLDLAGQARFGPDVRWVPAIDYDFDDSRRSAFIQAIRRYYPDLDGDRLQPGYTGIRPKLVGPGEADADFMILGPADHGEPHLVHLLGIESPGLTAALALAETVVAVLSGR